VTFAALPLAFLGPLRLRANLKAKLKFGLFLYEGPVGVDIMGEGLGELTVGDAVLVTEHWDNSDELSYISSRISSGAPTACARDEAGEAVAWGLTHSEGAVGAVYTLESSRRQGLGEQVVKELTRRLLARGQSPFCYISEKNEASAGLFEKCGYVRHSQAVFWALCQGPAPPDSDDSI